MVVEIMTWQPIIDLRQKFEAEEEKIHSMEFTLKGLKLFL
jgi:hypothetical protein